MSDTQNNVKSNEKRKEAEQELGIVQGMEEKEPILTQLVPNKILDKKLQQ